MIKKSNESQIKVISPIKQVLKIPSYDMSILLRTTCITESWSISPLRKTVDILSIDFWFDNGIE